MDKYLDFLRSKRIIAPESGFEVSAEELPDILKPHQKDALIWALRGGRRAVFAKFGMGKTVIQLVFCQQVLKKFGGIGTVPLTALKMGRRGIMTELNNGYFRDAVGYLQAEEENISQPTLFDLFMDKEIANE